MTTPIISPVSWSGNWEDRGERIVCRWMIAWASIKSGILGAIAGYSGGGAFQLEKFFLSGEGHYYIEANDDLSFLSSQQIEACEDCVDLILSFHSDADWIEAETLHLLHERIAALMADNGGYSGGEEIPESLLSLFSLIGLISYPSSKN